MVETPRARRQRINDTGSVLILIPAGVLVLVILGAIAVDFATVYLGERQLADAAASAAADAASSLSDSAFYRSGQVRIDPGTAERVAQQSVASQSLSSVHLMGPVSVQVQGREVCVTLTGQVDRIFGRAIPGVAPSTTVHARATATAAGDTGSGVPERTLC